MSGIVPTGANKQTSTKLKIIAINTRKQKYIRVAKLRQIYALCNVGTTPPPLCNKK
jgi:hypothetical protein